MVMAVQPVERQQCREQGHHREQSGPNSTQQFRTGAQSQRENQRAHREELNGQQHSTGLGTRNPQVMGEDRTETTHWQVSRFSD